MNWRRLINSIIGISGYGLTRVENIKTISRVQNVEASIERGAIAEHDQKHNGQINAFTAGPAGKQLAFLHIGKTAGTSLKNVLFSTFSDVPTYHHDVSNFDNEPPEEFRKYGLIIGHFSYWHTAKFVPENFLFTFLRDPVERVISSYFFLRTQNRTPGDGDNGVRISAAKTLSFSEFIRSELPPVQAVVRNLQTNALGGDWRYLPKIGAEELLERALSNLQRISFVGITERYDESVKRLFARLELPSPLPADRSNVTPDRLRIADIDAADLAYLNEVNTLDRRLYAEAVRIFERSR